MRDGTEEDGAACRTALVTGGTSGLGLAMAAALARAGLRVALTGRSADRAAAVAANLHSASGPASGPAFGLALDVRDEDSVAAAVEAAWSRLDRRGHRVAVPDHGGRPARHPGDSD